MTTAKPGSSSISDDLRTQIGSFFVLFPHAWATPLAAEGLCLEASQEFDRHLRELRFVGAHQIFEFWTELGDGLESENHFANVVVDLGHQVVVDWTARQFDEGLGPRIPYPLVRPISRYAADLGWDRWALSRR